MSTPLQQTADLLSSMQALQKGTQLGHIKSQTGYMPMKRGCLLKVGKDEHVKCGNFQTSGMKGFFKQATSLRGVWQKKGTAGPFSSETPRSPWQLCAALGQLWTQPQMPAEAVPRTTSPVWCSLPAPRTKNIKEECGELSQGKVILNLHLSKAQSFVFVTPFPGQIFSFLFHIHP